MRICGYEASDTGTGVVTGQAEPETADERWEITQQLRPVEAASLAIWADTNDAWLDADEFTARWQQGGSIEGGEHQVFAQNGLVYKRNNLLYHASWLEYFHRLVLHNWLFSETQLTFEGLMWVDDELQPVVYQAIIETVRGVSQSEVESEMHKRGFHCRKADNYYSPTLGILVEDLHDENVLVSPKGSLLIFDPVIYLVWPEIGLVMPEMGRAIELPLTKRTLYR